MNVKTDIDKAECINPNTGRVMNIDKNTYDLFSKAIYHSLMRGKELTFSEIVTEVDKCIKEQKAKFEGSLSWYAISVKNDMQARGIIETVGIKGKKLNRLKK
ncbi:MAG TPA: hypothetical protein VFQ73_12530 [Flavisolibacter sp.]|nr:hypothetical protein [Flavisolibacter sp.]